MLPVALLLALPVAPPVVVAVPASAGVVIECDGVAATIVGTPDEPVVGTEGDDVIVSAGAPSVDALGGADRVCVTDAAADVDLGVGDDVLAVPPGGLPPGTLLAGGDGLDRLSVGADNRSDVLVDARLRVVEVDSVVVVEGWVGFEGYSTSTPRNGDVLDSLAFRGTGADELLTVFRVRRLDADLRGGDDVVRIWTPPAGTSGRAAGGGGRDRVELTGDYDAVLDLAEHRAVASPGAKVTTVRGFADATLRQGRLRGDAHDNSLVSWCARVWGGDGDDRVVEGLPVGVAFGAPSVVEPSGCTVFTAYGGRGADVLVGSLGRDLLDGGRGRDRADGLAGSDRCLAERQVRCEK